MSHGCGHKPLSLGESACCLMSHGCGHKPLSLGESACCLVSHGCGHKPLSLGESACCLVSYGCGHRPLSLGESLCHTVDTGLLASEKVPAGHTAADTGLLASTIPLEALFPGALISLVVISTLLMFLYIVVGLLVCLGALLIACILTVA